MRYILQFGRILGFCFVGELCAWLLPLPVPASIYGLVLLLLALKIGLVKLEQVRETGVFLTKIFPILFVPIVAGVMDLWEEIRAMLLPILLAGIPATALVMGVTGVVTQKLARRKGEPSDAA